MRKKICLSLNLSKLYNSNKIKVKLFEFGPKTLMNLMEGWTLIKGFEDELDIHIAAQLQAAGKNSGMVSNNGLKARKSLS